MGQKILMQFFLFGKCAQVFIHPFHASVVRHQFHGRFRADTGNAGNVVGTVPGKAQHVHELLRRKPVIGLHGVHVNDHIFHGVPDDAVFVHKLDKILVPGDHDHLEALFHGHFCKCTHKIVRFHALFFHDRDVHGTNDFFDVRNLGGEILVHGRPVRLVLLVDLVPERGAFCIEKHAHVFRTFVMEQLEKNPGETERGVGGMAP